MIASYRARRIFGLILAAVPLSLAAASLDPPGVGNFHEVGDHIYRGAQPTDQGIQSLARLGVKTIIDLRGGDSHRRAEEKVVKTAGMRYVHVPLKGFGAPQDEEMSKLLALLDDSSGWPVFVHCKRGADRTGTVIACYRIAHDHWQGQKALTEAKLHGTSWLERAMQQYILRFEATYNRASPQSDAKPVSASP